MKNIFLIFLLFMFFPLIAFGETNKTDSLLKELDKVISQRDNFLRIKEEKISELKEKKQKAKTLEEQININRDIIDEYNSFICDSAEHYINQNLEIAKKLNNKELILENSFRLAYIYSLSGLFLQAAEIFDSINYEALPTGYKAWYCWNRIRYYENLINYTADTKFSKQYEKEKEEYREKVMGLLYNQSDEYKKELACKLETEGRYQEAINLLIPIFHKQQPETHDYAMAAMNLAKVYKLAKKYDEEEYYLILAATTDIKLAVKENEALLSLALNLYNRGDVNRAYNYIRVALDDALFYNARFKNSVIARVQPIIEDTYLQKIKYQQKILRLYSMLTSAFVIALACFLFFIYKQNKALTKARKELREANDNLLHLNQKLDEANIIKERYLGFL